jgi:Delta7-sterol 5-desaturase
MPILPDLLQPVSFLVSFLLFFAVIAGRFFLIAGFFQAYFFVWRKKQWQSRQVFRLANSSTQFKKEIRWSLINCAIFALIGVAAVLAWQQGFTKIYFEPLEKGWWWLPISFVISMALHETYYYFLHRWMHHPSVFRHIHKVHHDSKITSVWTAFSFHPMEGFLQAIFLPLLLLVLPMHCYVLILQLTIMSFSSVINHLEVEIYPKGFNKHWLGKWLIGATHHALHHKQFKYNFGLYFTWWDKWRKTESPVYHSLFEEKTKG